MKNFTKKNLYDLDGIGENGKPYKKITVLFTDSSEDPSICDCCNEKKPCIHFDNLSKNVSIICKDCLKLMLNTFNE